MDDQGIPSGDGDCIPNVQAKSKAGLSLVSSEERGGIVSARGTGDGLILRLDGRVRLHDLKKAIDGFMESRESFISGNSVAIEWTGSFPGEVFIEELSDHLQENYRITVKSSCLKGARPTVSDASPATKESATTKERSLSLFDGVGNLQLDAQVQAVGDSGLAAEIDTSALFDDADARIMLTTLRSGQRIETEHSVVICGDVNFGAEIVAGGDVIVLGTLRGVAHAGAFDETGGGRFIFSLDLRPTQLRIGSVISRGGPEEKKKPQKASDVPEIARVEGDFIVVEPYKARARNLRVSGK